MQGNRHSTAVRRGAAVALAAVVATAGATGCSKRIGRNLGEAAGKKAVEDRQGAPSSSGTRTLAQPTTSAPPTTYLKQGPSPVVNQPPEVWKGGPEGAKAFVRYYYAQVDTGRTQGGPAALEGLVEKSNCWVTDYRDTTAHRCASDVQDLSALKATGARFERSRTRVVFDGEPFGVGANGTFRVTYHLVRDGAVVVEKNGKRTPVPPSTSKPRSAHVGPGPGVGEYDRTRNQPFMLVMIE